MPDAVPAVVERYRRGESIEEIARDNRVARRTIYRWMLAGLGDEKYHELVTEVLVSRVSDADEELSAARLSKDPVQVSAAREACRFSRQDLERRRPALYGQKQEVKHTVVPVLNYVLLEKPSASAIAPPIDVPATAVHVTPVPALPVREVGQGEKNVKEEPR